jgi:hypothetical protein
MADHPVEAGCRGWIVDPINMDPINIPERLDPSSRIDSAEPHHSTEERENCRKKMKPQTSAAEDLSAGTDDESHQLDELA